MKLNGHPNSSDSNTSDDDRDALVKRLQEALRLTESKIISRQEELDELDSERRKLLVSINSVVGAPVQRLPNEILAEVFTIITQVAARLRPAPVWEDLDFLPQDPFNLSLVCRAWYDLLSSTPVVWSTVVLNLLSRKVPMNAAALLRRYLSLSEPVPLRVCLAVQQYDSMPDDEESRPQHVGGGKLEEIVLEFRHRITHLEIASDGDPFIYSPSSLDFPSLTYLHYSWMQNSDPTVVPNDSGFHWLSDVPNLREVYLDDGSLCRSLTEYLPFCDGIETLRTTSCRLDQAYELVSPLATRLRAALLEIDTHVPNSEMALGPINLPVFEELYADFTRPEDDGDEAWMDPFSALWGSLTCPALQTLYIADTDSPDLPPRVWDWDAFERFIARSQLAPSLSHLIISSSVFTNADALKAIDTLHNLTFLSLYGKSDHLRGMSATSLDVIRHLTPRFDAEGNVEVSVLPRLETLRLSLRSAIDVIERIRAVHLLAESRRHRRWNGERLERLHLWVDDIQPSEYSEAVERLVSDLRSTEAGLALRVL